MKNTLHYLALLVYIHKAAAISYFFPNGTFVPDNNVSTGCSNALQASVQCLPDLMVLATTDNFAPTTNTTYQSILCNKTCGSSLTSYIANVTTACKNDRQPFTGLPATYHGLLASSTWNLTCLQDSNGQYCLKYLYGLYKNVTNLNSTSTLADLPQSQLCVSCVYLIIRQIASTTFSNFRAGLLSQVAAVGSKCSVSLPSTVPNPVANLTQLPGYVRPGTTLNATCLSGKMYTVVSGDTGRAISQKQGVSTGTLLRINKLLPDGSDLQLGQALCLPKTCSTTVVKSNDTCAGLAKAAGYQFQQFLAWNPDVNPYCTNLVSGNNVCVSPPAGTWNGTTIQGASVTKTNIYATSTVAAPGPTASGTTTRCGQFYKVVSGDYCQLIALNQTIDLGLFEAINPSINQNCTNLVPGLFYCVEPLRDWNSTVPPSSTTSTYVPPPTQTPPGSTSHCYQWYTVKSGDSCSLIQSSFGITMRQLQTWNPDLKSDCSNLLLGEAYCVKSNDPVSTTAAKMAKKTLGPVRLPM